MAKRNALVDEILRLKLVSPHIVVGIMAGGTWANCQFDHTVCQYFRYKSCALNFNKIYAAVTELIGKRIPDNYHNYTDWHKFAYELDKLIEERKKCESQ